MAQRLEKLERVMGKLVEKITPEDSGNNGTPSTERLRRDSSTLPTESNIHRGLDMLEASGVDDTPIGLLLNLRQMNTAAQSSQGMMTPESFLANQPSVGKASSRHEKLSRTLFALFPHQESVDTIIKFSTGSHFIASQFYSFRDIIQGQAEMSSAICDIPPATSHPAVLARKLLQLVICIQQLRPEFDYENLQLKASRAEVMAGIINIVANNVTSNDNLVCTQEGLECLIMQGLWHENAGNLRKAWLTFRRAMSVAQFMGIDRAKCNTLNSADPSPNPRKRITPEIIWFRITYRDRYLSLILGLPVGSLDSNFASDEAMQGLTAMERLERLQTVASARIVERNRNKSTQDYVVTQAIDFDLEAAARSMETGWWAEPSVQTFEDDDHVIISRIMCILLQIHHYSLLVLLHLPYMLHDPTENRYHYSKATCTRSSREVLQRFISFRALVNSPFSCRHVDYAALIAAMTLLLSYLKQHGNTSQPQPILSFAQQQEDRKLIMVVRERILAVMNHDKVSKASAEIIEQMMPILDSIDSSPNGNTNLTDPGLVRLSIPYVGAVNFHPSMGENAAPIPISPRESLGVNNNMHAQQGQPRSPHIHQGQFPPLCFQNSPWTLA
ncbi:Transcription factor sdnS [Penicillium cf. griseofulvum]|nr:Transcription factor sdnS [Penicillium cf. griseofulvum]